MEEVWKRRTKVMMHKTVLDGGELAPIPSSSGGSAGREVAFRYGDAAFRTGSV
jgi:hypothetical protein